MNNSSRRSYVFYQGDKLIMVKHDDQHRAVFRTPDMPLAEPRVAGGEAYGLFATDAKASVLSVQETDKGEHHAYSAYGHDPKLPSLLTLLGFNGEAFALVPGCYALGNGYRSFRPAMMRFISPDRLSPFGKGGINGYCYCSCDPVNNVDPSGQMKRRLRPSAQMSQPATSITSINEPDVFSRIVRHLDLRSAAAFSRANKHLYRMTRPAFQKIERSLGDPGKLVDAALAGTVGPALGHSYELLVKRPDITLPPQSFPDGARDQLIRDIEAARKFREAQRTRLPSYDTSSGSDSDDELRRINRGIRKALNGKQL
ncbi:RHS repeat-associated core domain-containing protein [Pseudomonas sp. Kh13]|uniref:RHS repeat-associated core domain-containing protein n=1 Tax=Pseudomonas sp. Kh13 TaxID=2093744 RepID=UPI0011831440|nr:RHS repeat-associated core domain-containing protein [Pseudomonas sp. Kh13]